MKIKTYIAFHTEDGGRYLRKEEVVTVKKAINGYYIVTKQGNYITKYFLTTDNFDVAEEFAR
jgi:hypothetical protein